MHVHRSSSGVHPSSVHHKLHCVCVCVWASTYQWSNVDSCVLLCSPISRALFDYFPAAGEHHAGNLSFYEGDIVEVSIRYHCIHVYGIAVCWICTTVVCVRMCMPALRVSFHHTLLHFNTMLQEAKNLTFFVRYFCGSSSLSGSGQNLTFSWDGHRSAWILTVDPLKSSYVPYDG